MGKKVGNAIGFIGGSILIVATFTSALFYGLKKIIKK
ncbi:MAG: hypothetical protein RLZZ267_192 [Bacillota bacterium]|jgi:hypothetical protein